VVGPYAKPGHISAQLNSHVSLLRFCQFTFGLDALTDRDAASHGMTDCIDTSQQPNAHP
jgi:phospholipase C